jgi:hypothetical protein
MLTRLSAAVYSLSVGTAVCLLAIGSADLPASVRAVMDSWPDVFCWVALAAAVYACGWLFRSLFGPQAPSLNIDHDL